jgi:hypothetical protein
MCKQRFSVTLSVTTTIFENLLQLDRELVGTSEYMGLCIFWAYEYRHILRDVSDHTRRQIHAAFLKAGLDVRGVSPKHEEILKRFEHKVRQ